MAASNSPYSTALASGAIDFDFENSLNPSQQMRKYKTEEQEAKAPNILPYEFSELPQNLANIVDNAFNAATNIENILKMEDYKDNPDLLKLKHNLEKIFSYLMNNGDKTLSKFTKGH
jgi:hypothetical protein